MRCSACGVAPAEVYLSTGVVVLVMCRACARTLVALNPELTGQFWLIRSFGLDRGG